MQKYIASLVHTSIFRTRALTQRLLPGLRTARHLFMLILVLAGAFQPQAPVMAAAGLTIIPLAWNITGLDSNDVTVGPNVYPAGFRVCNTDTVNAATNVTSTWNWDTSNAYINLRSGSRSSITTASLAPNTCVDHYYEIEITRTTLAYSTARRFHVTATSDQVPAGVSTVTPREIYVQKIVSQARNNVTDVLLNGASIPIGGTLNVVVGGTYDITLIADTATNGFEQIETYIDLYNTIFRINKVTTAYSANGGTDPNAGNKLYADGCGWVNDPTLPTYRSCSGTGKYGGIVTITYNVTILSGGGTSQILNSLIFDYSGTSYHYNKDFPAARFLSILLPPVIAKAFNPSTIAAGAISTLTFTITNPNANVPLQGVAFTDTFPTTPGAMVVATPPNASTVGCGTPTFAPVAGAGSISFSGGTIAAGGTCTIHVDVTAPVAGTYVNTSGPVTTIMGGAVGTGNTATATLTVIAPAPAISLTKSANPTTYNAVGQVITYTYTIKNTGNVTLFGPFNISDDKLGTIVCQATPTPSLAPNASLTCTATHTITQADIDAGKIVNIATASTGNLTSNPATATVTAVQTPALTLVKTATPLTYDHVGQIITYSYVITNTGNVTLSGPFTITDDKTTAVCPATASLAPGASITCAASYTITQADLDAGKVTNTATATNGTVTSPPATATVTAVQRPGLSITKVATETSFSAVGDVIHYTIVATNTGNTTLTSVTVTDPSVSNLTCNPANGSSLAPGQTMTCTATHTITQADIDAGFYANTACVSDGVLTPVCASKNVPGTKTSALTITKVAQETSFSAVGDVIHYTIVATNTGNTTLAAVTVTDPKVTGLTCTPANGSQLLPGASMTCTATHTITQADIDAGSFANTACVNATGATEACATKNVPSSKKPALTLVKTVTEKNFGAAGVVLHYTLVATNTGNTTISGVTITDPKLGTLTCTPAQPATLAPSETLTCTGTYITKAVDVTALVVNNTATATATGIPPVTASAKVPFVGLPIGIKTVSASNLPTLRWTMVWINQTNIPKLKARVSDPIPAGTVYAGVLVCTPASPLTITTSCVFEAPSAAYPRGRVIWEGTLGPDAGHKTPETAQNELTISFNTTVDSSVNKVVNVGTIDVDIDGNGTYTPNEMKVVTVTAAWNRPANKPKKLPATGFAPNVVTSLPAQPEYSLYQSYSDFSLEIPSLGVMTNIVGVPFANDAWDTTWLGNNAGYLAGTAFPTWDGNSVITGHVYGYNGLTGPFVNIGKLSWGQQIVIRAFGERYIYSVRSVQTVNPDDLSVLDHKDNPWVTLITCKEFDPASYSYRLRTVVQAVLIQVVDNLER